MRVSTELKIRFLLTVLTVSFFITALTIRLTYNQQQVLVHDGKKIERNLQLKEQLIFDFLSDSLERDKFTKVIAGDGEVAESLIAHFSTQHQIFLYLYKGSKLEFWTTDQYVPPSSSLLHQSSTIIRDGNGWFRVVRHKGSTGLNALFLIPIKWAYQKENAYLSNEFVEDLIGNDNLDIADYNDREVYNVRDKHGQYLFSVKLSVTQFESFYSDLEMLMWVLGLLFTVVLIHFACLSLAKKGFVWLSILVFAALLVLLRWIELSLGWFSANFHTALFDPRVYASSTWFPHLGGFLVNIVLMTWWSAYFFSIRRMLVIPKWLQNPVGYFSILALFATIFYAFCSLLLSLFADLVNNSDINFDVSDFLNLDAYGWLGIISLCLGMTILSLNVGWMVHIVQNLIPDKVNRLRSISVVIVLTFLVLFIVGSFNIYVILLGIFVLLRAMLSYSVDKYVISVVIASLLIMAAVSALKHNELHRHKRQEAQKRAILKLEAVDDASALALMPDLENELAKDTVLKRLVSKRSNANRIEVEEHLKKVYFSGYLSRYDMVAECFDANFVPFSDQPRLDLHVYRDKVISGANMVSRNFYRQANINYGDFSYFAQFPFYDDTQLLGIILIDIKNRSVGQSLKYPAVLADSRLNQRPQEMVSYYSSAFYRDGTLINQSGRYVYPTSDSLFLPLETRKFKPLGAIGGYSHLAYKPDQRTMIILGKPEKSGWMQFAVLSFFFLVYLLFFLIVFVFSWFIQTLSANDFSLRNLRWSFLVQTNRILYSTRIQTFIVVSVVLTLITAGIITFFSLSGQFTNQQERNIANHAWEIAKSMESRVLTGGGALGLDWRDEFIDVAQSNALDLNLYDIRGKLIYTTQPRIYDLQLISEYMHANAFVHLDRFARSRYIQLEQIGRLNYLSAYAALRDSENNTIAYLNLPNYASQEEFDQNLGVLLNTLINIYALVIVILGLFAVFIANKITAPLSMVQRSLARTKIGKQNEPIFWKRNDEIGSLIREYNLMIAELEQSADRLMQSERETAWKEMAKQVAHEIKNPLTPLKLGVQQLERSWRDKDPRFEARFQTFISSFIEQIDSLTHIATEFSDFARMPDANYEVMDLESVISSSVAVFANLNNVTIRVERVPIPGNDGDLLVKGDKDQLLRTFNNLLKNSIEACAKKRRCHITIVITGDADYALVKVTDDGEGITPEAQKKLFQPNFTTKTSGTGLGLAFVKRAIEAIGGQIRYQTLIGEGTTFFIKIPRYKED